MSRVNRFAPHPHEFKVKAVRLVRESGKSTRDIATDLGASIVSCHRWLKDLELGGTASSSNLDAEERAELRRKVRIFRKEREILKSRGLLLRKRLRTRILFPVCSRGEVPPLH